MSELLCTIAAAEVVPGDELTTDTGYRRTVTAVLHHEQEVRITLDGAPFIFKAAPLDAVTLVMQVQ